MLFKNIAMSSTLLLAVLALPADAGDLLGGVTKSLGGETGGVSKTVGGVTGGLGGVTGSLGSTTTSVSATVGDSIAKANVNVGKITPRHRKLLINEVRVRLSGLSEKQLLKLCASVGGDSCGSMSRQERTKLVDAQIRLLDNNTLLGVCASVGGSCGGDMGRPRTPPTARADAGSRSGTARMYCSPVLAEQNRCVLPN